MFEPALLSSQLASYKNQRYSERFELWHYRSFRADCFTNGYYIPKTWKLTRIFDILVDDNRTMDLVEPNRTEQE